MATAFGLEGTVRRNSRMIPLCMAANELIARMCEEYLLEQDIPSLVQSLGASAAYGAPTLDRHRVLVREEDIIRAVGVLEPLVGPDLELLPDPLARWRAEGEDPS